MVRVKALKRNSLIHGVSNMMGPTLDDSADAGVALRGNSNKKRKPASAAPAKAASSSRVLDAISNGHLDEVERLYRLGQRFDEYGPIHGSRMRAVEAAWISDNPALFRAIYPGVRFEQDDLITFLQLSIQSATPVDSDNLRHLVEDTHGRVDVHACDEYGHNAIAYAALLEQRGPEVIRYLASQGVNPAAENVIGQTPRVIAEYYGLSDNVEAIDTLVQAHDTAPVAG